MKLLRTSCYLLLALDVVLLGLAAAPVAGVALPRTGDSEPERIANQLHPERIRVLPVSAEGAVLTSVAASSSSSASSEPPHAQAESSEPVVTAEPDSAPASVCVAYRGLSGDQIQLLASGAKAQSVAMREISAPAVPTSWWVNIPPQGGKEAAERRTDVLRRNGVQDFFVVQESGATQYAISLGLFRNEAAAKRQLEMLQSKGVTTARITTREPRDNTRVELTGPSAVLERLGNELGAKLKGAETGKCQVG
ncbi:MAG: SPOR domain-containing protein [Rhodocyclaceae bacterium]